MTPLFMAELGASRTRQAAGFSAADIRDFETIVHMSVDLSQYPLADSAEKNVVVYKGSRLRAALASDNKAELMDELYRCLSSGPGVFVIKELVEDLRVIDRANVALERVIEDERAGTGVRGDHFAPGGSNDRIWNSFQKHAEADPASFAEYYANDLLSLASEAWLGLGYQITAQTNIVKPGGKAQEPHRDYHLGFQSEAMAATFPSASQIASQFLTLQLAIAHSDMPLESGPTQLLPFSHQYPHGYLSYRHDSFAAVFKDNFVQVPLKKGDALFFTPALFHAAGDNRSNDLRRSANLMQVSACWSRPMETVDRDKILRLVWSDMKALKERGGEWESLAKAVADGYSFPTNLDRDPPPNDGHCPPSQLDLVMQGLYDDWSGARLAVELDAYIERHKA